MRATRTARSRPDPPPAERVPRQAAGADSLPYFCSLHGHNKTHDTNNCNVLRA